MIKIPIEQLIKEDIGHGDITTAALIEEHKTAKARIVAGEDCILAGVKECSEVFRYFDVSVEAKRQDGTAVKKNEMVMRVWGSAAGILAAERTALNILSRMSGIATATKKIVDACKRTNPRIRIAATRKTTPGFRYYEKKAVMIGGGDPHRYGLYDAILIKDNHLALLNNDVKSAVEKAKRQASFAKKIEIEVENIKDAITAARAGADIIMLDNMALNDVAEAYRKIKEIDSKIVVEVSGGITIENAPSYAKHCDVISLGRITHSVRSVDFSLEIEHGQD